MIPWTIARQAPLSMGFSRQEYWSGLSFPSLILHLGIRKTGSGINQPLKQFSLLKTQDLLEIMGVTEDSHKDGTHTSCRMLKDFSLVLHFFSYAWSTEAEKSIIYL